MVKQVGWFQDAVTDVISVMFVLIKAVLNNHPCKSTDADKGMLYRYQWLFVLLY